MIDLVLTDVSLEPINGFEIARRMRIVGRAPSWRNRLWQRNCADLSREPSQKQSGVFPGCRGIDPVKEKDFRFIGSAIRIQLASQSIPQRVPYALPPITPAERLFIRQIPRVPAMKYN
jgi:hypothetical protein